MRRVLFVFIVIASLGSMTHIATSEPVREVLSNVNLRQALSNTCLDLAEHIRPYLTQAN